MPVTVKTKLNNPKQKRLSPYRLVCSSCLIYELRNIMESQTTSTKAGSGENWEGSPLSPTTLESLRQLETECSEPIDDAIPEKVPLESKASATTSIQQHQSAFQENENCDESLRKKPCLEPVKAPTFQPPKRPAKPVNETSVVGIGKPPVSPFLLLPLYDVDPKSEPKPDEDVVGQQNVEKARQCLKVVFVEGLDNQLVFDANSRRSRKLQERVVFASVFTSSTTHYVVDFTKQSGALKTLYYFMAKATNTWLLYPAWFDAIRDRGTVPSEEDYEFTLNCSNYPMHSLSKRERNTQLFVDLKIVFLAEFPIIAFPFTSVEMGMLLASAGANVKFFKLDQFLNAVKAESAAVVSSPQEEKDFVIASTTCRKSKICDELFSTFHWTTVRPDFFISCLEENELRPPHLHYVLTSMDLYCKKIIDKQSPDYF